jgi:hypothetical protein
MPKPVPSHPGAVPPALSGHTGGFNPTRPVVHQDPPKVIEHKNPSQWDNPISKRHLDDSSSHFHDISQHNPSALRAIGGFESKYRSEFRQHVYNRNHEFAGVYADENHRYYNSGWFPRGFYGGFWYPVLPCFDVESYFAYPTVFWLFYTDIDYAGYWENYYGPGWSDGDSDPAPAPVAAFPFAGVFYPTDTLRDLGMEVSAMSADAQVNFQTAMVNFVQEVQDEVSDQRTAPITLNQFDLVVNHYQNLQDQAIVVEGFVSHNGIQYAFKALIDLLDPSQTITFIPSSQDPTGANDANLQIINQRIIELGGDPYTADQEPTTIGATPSDLGAVN